MSTAKFAISFRIRHPNIDPEEITSRLSLRPRTSWRAGTARATPSGTQLAGTHGETYWSYEVPATGEPGLAERLAAVTRILKSHEAFLRRLKGTGGRLEYFIGWFAGANTGEVLGWDLLSQIAGAHIDLALDVYCDSSGKSES